MRTGRALTLLCFLVVGCHEKPPASEKREPKTGVIALSKDNLEYIRVEAAEAPPTTASRSLFARVGFDERKLVALGAPVSGRVTEVDVTTGATVSAGQALLTIHSSDLAAVNAEVAEATHSRMLAEQVAARAGILVSQGAGSQAELDQAKTALDNAREEERRAKEAQSALGAKGPASSYVLKSPIAGSVVERSVSVGNAVSADQGAALITVADLSRVWVLVDVFEQDLPYIRPGNPARVLVPALRNQGFDGAVAYVSDVLDDVSRTARARIEIDNAERLLRPGMFAEVEVKGPEVAAAWVPTSAVLARRDDFFVFVRRGSEGFESRSVEVGRESAGHMTILKGLAPGEEVVTRGAILLDAEANAAF
jgi:cobalt-zinc-cadmium efflux system membrane fusion protein